MGQAESEVCIESRLLLLSTSHCELHDSVRRRRYRPRTPNRQPRSSVDIASYIDNHEDQSDYPVYRGLCACRIESHEAAEEPRSCSSPVRTCKRIYESPQRHQDGKDVCAAVHLAIGRRSCGWCLLSCQGSPSGRTLCLWLRRWVGQNVVCAKESSTVLIGLQSGQSVGFDYEG